MAKTTNLRVALQTLCKQFTPFVIEAVVVRVNKGNTCDVVPITYYRKGVKADNYEMIYYDVPFPAVFTPEVDSFCLVGFVTASTPYILVMDKLAGITIGGNNNDSDSVEDPTVKKNLSKNLLSNKGALVTDGSFRFSLNHAGIISVNGVYYGFITVREQAQIEIFNNYMNLAVNESGKIYFGKTIAKKVKEFTDVNMLSVNSPNSAIDSNPTNAVKIKYYNSIIEFLATHIDKNSDEFYNLWNQFVVNHPGADKYLGSKGAADTDDTKEKKIKIKENTPKLNKFIDDWKAAQKSSSNLSANDPAFAEALFKYYSDNVSVKNVNDSYKVVYKSKDPTLATFLKESNVGGDLKTLIADVMEDTFAVSFRYLDITSSETLEGYFTIKLKTDGSYVITGQINDGPHYPTIPASTIDNLQPSDILNAISKVLEDIALDGLGIEESRLTNKQFLNYLKLHTAAYSPAGGTVSANELAGSWLKELLSSMYQYSTHLITPGEFKNLINDLSTYVALKETSVDSNAINTAANNLQNKFKRIEDIIYRISLKGKDKTDQIDILTTPQVQKESLINLNDILSEIGDTVSNLSNDIKDLIQLLNTTPAANGTNLLLPPATLTITTNLDRRIKSLKDTKDKIDNLLAVEQQPIEIK